MAYKYPYDYEEKKYEYPKLKTDRKMWKLKVFNILTLGLYGIFFFIPVSYDLDKADPRRERGKTMNYFVAYVVAFLTFSIALLVWHYQIATRIEEALKRRDIDYEFGTDDFWKWYILGSFILVGSFIYFHKFCKAMNLICQSYNEKPVLDKNEQ